MGGEEPCVSQYLPKNTRLTLSQSNSRQVGRQLPRAINRNETDIPKLLS